MMTFTDKHIKEARMIAIQAHGNQTYDGVYPYIKHLDDVADVLRRFGYGGKYIIAAYLHDIMEDTSISYKKIKTLYGEEVAEMVYCVTDELGRNRVEKKAKTLPKTASNPKAIELKLGDRIANIEHGGKIDMYAKEYSQFKGVLFLNSPKDAEAMWHHLEKNLLKLEEYTT